MNSKNSKSESQLYESQETQALKAWRQSADKDNQLHYQCNQLQQQYDEHEMPKRIKDALNWISKPARRLLQLRPPTETHLRLLSLGCGPGSDLLAGVQSLLKLGLSSSSKISCTGVDLECWNRTRYFSELRLLRKTVTACACPRIDSDFRQEDLQTFVLKMVLRLLRLHRTGKNVELAQFDLITLSYANAKETLQDGVLEILPLILRPGGSIVIIDNNTAPLRELVRPIPGYKTVYKNKCKLVFVYKAKV